jgi:hypothetical protein
MIQTNLDPQIEKKSRKKKSVSSDQSCLNVLQNVESVFFPIRKLQNNMGRKKLACYEKESCCRIGEGTRARAKFSSASSSSSPLRHKQEKNTH